MATANQLSFLDTRTELANEASAAPLENLHRSLDRDYRLLTYLLRHAATYNVNGQSIEERILMLDYRIMSAWFLLTRGLNRALARKALLEKASIVNHLANAMGERVAVASRG